MVNSELLSEKLEKSGYKTSYVVEKLGISRNAFYRKRDNKIPFRAAEIYVLCDLLRIQESEKDSVFFAE